MRNCLVSDNIAWTNVGGIFCQTGLIENCTIASNNAGVLGGGAYFDSVSVTGLNNIIYYNTAPSANNFTNTAGGSGLNYSCVIPAVEGTGNITNDPAFVNTGAGNYRLRADSPCVNSGANQSWMTNSFDLDGRTRIRYGAVDMGAYEIIYDGSIYHIGF